MFRLCLLLRQKGKCFFKIHLYRSAYAAILPLLRVRATRRFPARFPFAPFLLRKNVPNTKHGNPVKRKIRLGPWVVAKMKTYL
jgi:hypothetical protein